MKRLMVAAAFMIMATIAVPKPAAAHVNFSIGIGLPFVGAVVAPPYVVPAPVYISPPVVYAPPVIYAPPAYYSYPSYYPGGYYRYSYRPQHFRGHGHHRRDWDD